VQLYEAVLCLFLCLVLARGFQNRKISGERFLMLGIGYSIIRFSLEFLRADNPPVAFNLTFSQGICGLVIIVCAITLLWRRRFADARSLRLPAPTA
jgi:prolipoprotein diacylglyceryltransferase